jgi:hypothetical protein
MDLLVFENKVYILTRKHIRIYSLKFEKLFEAPLENGKRFRRENDVILVMADNSIQKYDPEKGMVKIFEDKDAQIVDKNILSYFEIKANKLYLYSLEKIKETKLQTEPETKQVAPPAPEPPSEQPVGTEVEKTDVEKTESDKKAPDNTLQKLMEDTSEVQAAGI